MRPYKRPLWLGKKAAAPAPSLVEYIVGMGAASTASNRPPNTVEINISDTALTPRSGLSFQVVAGTNQGNGPTAAVDGRFSRQINGNSAGTFWIDFIIPDGTYRLWSAQGTDFTGLSPGLRIRSIANLGVNLHAVNGTAAATHSMDILGADVVPANYDATAGFKDITVTGGQGIRVDRGTIGSHFYMTFMRIKQLS